MTSAAPILWYVHDQGSGHLARARAVVPLLRSPVVVAVGPGQAGAAAALPCPVVALPSDVPERALPTTGPWHHAPVCSEVRRRALALADCVAASGCSTVVVDVSAEVVALARLLGMRVIAVRQSGRRDDDAHRTAFASADAVWIPQHPILERHLGAVDERWRFTGAFSRFDGDRRCADQRCATDHLAVVVVGAGGTSFDAAPWRRPAPPGWRVVVAGLPERWTVDGVCSVGRVADLGLLLRSADVVVASAGWGNVADAAACRARLAVVAEARPFDEQVVRAEALDAAGLAVHLADWPQPRELVDVAAAASGLEPQRWGDVHDGRGAQRAAALVEEVHEA